MCGQKLAYGQLKVYVSYCKGDSRKTNENLLRIT
ncbi:hypothetical protein T12_16832 [Trichinella patagoniensis]|uniref:Uncharacterized protein n=1 Tax=Trichinella patagoniensis TaxID=990121 RepID=A0A0V0YYS3_9BILA|nr:hypothetical protein T12_16832 [Trichinella patagoniensis]